MNYKENEIGREGILDSAAEVRLLVEILPDPVRSYLLKSDRLADLNEVVLDLGYFPEIRWVAELERKIDFGVVTQVQLDRVISAAMLV